MAPLSVQRVERFNDSHSVNFIAFRAVTGSKIERIVFNNVLLRFMAQILIPTFTANDACDANAVNLHREETLSSHSASSPSPRFRPMIHFQRYQVYCKLVAALR